MDINKIRNLSLRTKEKRRRKGRDKQDKKKSLAERLFRLTGVSKIKEHQSREVANHVIEMGQRMDLVQSYCQGRRSTGSLIQLCY